MKKRNLLVSMVLGLSMLATACSPAAASTTAAGGTTTAAATKAATTPLKADAKVLKLGHQAPAGTAYDDLAQTFKKYVEERSEGRFKVEIYNGGSLGGDRELMEALQVGNVEFNILTASDMGMFAKEMEVQDLPYLFNDWTEVFKFLDSDAAKQLYALSDPVGITTLAFMPRGFRHTTNNKKPLNTPSDLKGLKIRVAESSIYVDSFEAFGASPQSMAWGEVFTALQQGTVDGHENTIVTIRDYKIAEVQKYLSETGHMFGFAAITTNPKFLAELPAADQEIIRKAAIDAGKDIGAVQQANELKATEELKKVGMAFNAVDKKAFSDLLKPVYDKYFQNHDKKYYDAIKEAIK